MSRYCEVRLVKSFIAENMIHKDHNEKIKSITHKTLTQKDPQNRVTRNSVILERPSNEELPANKKRIVSGQHSKLNKRNKFNEHTPTTRKTQSLGEARHLNARGKLNSITPSDVTDMSKEQTKLKKKRNTHLIIWERKLTGAQRVSKRLSNLRTKNKNIAQQIEYFNLVPVALIKKKPVKPEIRNKIIRGKRTITKNGIGTNSTKEKLLHKEQTERYDEIQTKHPKPTSHKRNKHIVKSNSKIGMKNNFVDKETDDNESQKLFETTPISDSNKCVNKDFSVDESVTFENVLSPYKLTPKVSKSNSMASYKEEISSQTEENKNAVTEKIEIIQENCLVDSDVIIVELESVENMVIECPTEKSLYSSPCENKDDCPLNVKEETLANSMIVTDEEQCLVTQSDFITGINTIDKACNKECVNNSAPVNDNISEQVEIKPDENIHVHQGIS